MGTNMHTLWQGTLSAEKAPSRGAFLLAWALEEHSRLRPFMQTKIGPALRKDVNPNSPRTRVALWLSRLLLPKRKGACIPAALRTIRWRVEEGGHVVVYPDHWGPQDRP